MLWCVKQHFLLFLISPRIKNVTGDFSLWGPKKRLKLDFRHPQQDRKVIYVTRFQWILLFYYFSIFWGVLQVLGDLAAHLQNTYFFGKISRIGWLGIEVSPRIFHVFLGLDEPSNNFLTSSKPFLFKTAAEQQKPRAKWSFLCPFNCLWPERFGHEARFFSECLLCVCVTANAKKQRDSIWIFCHKKKETRAVPFVGERAVCLLNWEDVFS